MFNVGDIVRIRAPEEIVGYPISSNGQLALKYYQNCYAEITHIYNNDKYRLKSCDKDFVSDCQAISEFVDEIAFYIWPERFLDSFIVSLEDIPQFVTEDEYNAIMFEQVNK